MVIGQPGPTSPAKARQVQARSAMATIQGHKSGLLGPELGTSVSLTTPGRLPRLFRPRDGWNIVFKVGVAIAWFGVLLVCFWYDQLMINLTKIGVARTKVVWRRPHLAYGILHPWENQFRTQLNQSGAIPSQGQVTPSQQVWARQGKSELAQLLARPARVYQARQAWSRHGVIRHGHIRPEIYLPTNCLPTVYLPTNCLNNI